jgi:Fe-S cluster assembly iron-binding protein IscA
LFGYTASAAELIKSLVSSVDDSSLSGLRLSLDPAWNSLRMGLVNNPNVDDQVFSRHDTNVFVAEAVAARLERRVLDARIDGPRSVFFLADR